MAEADTESRRARRHEIANRTDRVVARLGIARSIGQEHAVDPQCQHRRGRCLRRHDGQPATASSQHPQNIVLDAEVVRGDMEAGGWWLLVSAVERPRSPGPLVGFPARHDLGQVQPRHRRCRPRGGKRALFAIRRHGFARDEAAVLRAFFPQYSRELASIDVGDRDHIIAREVTPEILFPAPVAGHARKIADDQSGSENAARFDIFPVDAGVADMRIRERDHLAGIRRIGQDFLVASDRGVEHDFPDAGAISAYRLAAKNRAIGQRKQSRTQGPIQRRHVYS